MKVIFLDIDGPITNMTWLEGKVKIDEETVIPYAWEQENCDALRRIIEATGAVVVISSDWKQYYSMEQIRSIFRHYNIPENALIGFTANDRPKLSAGKIWTRAHQIKEWVRKRKPEAWVALDDMDIGSEFKRYNKEMKWISESNHVQTIGDYCDFKKENMTLSQLESKIIEKLNGRERTTTAGREPSSTLEAGS